MKTSLEEMYNKNCVNKHFIEMENSLFKYTRNHNGPDNFNNETYQNLQNNTFSFS